MPVDLASLRSLLFTPGSDERKVGKALESEADGVIVDLEDAVIPAEKPRAREVLREALAAPRARAVRFVRINAAGTDFFADDVELVRELDIDGVVLPKASPEGVAAIAEAGLPVIAIAETAGGVRQAYEIAAGPNVVALMLGSVDLGTELGLYERPDGAEIHYARSKLVIDSAAAGRRPPFDAVHVAIRDDDGLRAQARLARDLGLYGKACIHPAQVTIVNEVFTPSEDEVDWARRIVDAAKAAEAEGRGAVALEGALVDAPVVARAWRIIGQSERETA